MLQASESALRIEPERSARNSDVALPSVKPDHPIDLGDVLDGVAAKMKDLDAEAFAGLRQGLGDLLRRLGEQRLHVAILGQFKRGKSTVLNALLGESLMPTAVVPVTAIPTHVQAGASPRVAISFRGERRPVEEFTAARAADLEEHLQRFVTEEANRDNRLDVATVQVFLPAPMLSKGMVLIDTPGIGSTLRHNTEATLGFLPQCDVALFVVSVDPPMTQAEAEFLATVLRHVPHLAFVLNKIDQLESREQAAALGFLRNILSQRTDVASDVRIFSVSARQAVDAKRTGDADLLARSGFDELETYLTEDLARQKSGLLRAAIARKAAAVLSEGLMTLQLALRSLQLPLADLEERVAAFERAAADFGRQRLTSKDLLAGDRTRVLEALEIRAERLRQEAGRHLTGISDRALAGATDGAGAQDALGAAIPLFFDEALSDLSDEMSQLVDVALRRHQGNADALVETVRAKAAQLFEIPYRPLERESDLRSRREPYWVTHDVGGLLDPISNGPLMRLLPSSLSGKRVRRALLERIDTLARRNVENIRWALRQNIDDTFRRFGSELDAQLAGMIAALHGATRSALAKRREQSPAIAAEVERLSALAEELTSVQALLQSAGRQLATSS